MVRAELDEVDRAIIEATQKGLPLTSRPYDVVAERVGVEPALVLERFQSMLDHGVVRRIGAVPNHYALGYRGNGMTVWDVDDAEVRRLGPSVGALDFVSHCYLRPRHLPSWPYNLFAMVHGRNRGEVRRLAQQIERLLGGSCCGHEILFSKRILKKTGLRI